MRSGYQLHVSIGMGAHKDWECKHAPLVALTRKRCAAQLLEASFGATASVTINVYTRNWIRTLSSIGPGVVANYWTDGNSAFNNYGNGYQAALQSMNLGALRYPGGEKSDSCAPALRCLRSPCVTSSASAGAATMLQQKLSTCGGMAPVRDAWSIDTEMRVPAESN